MTAGNGTGCVTGRVVLQIPTLDPEDITNVARVPLKDIQVGYFGITDTGDMGDELDSMTTDGDGFFQFDDIPAGDYQLCVAPAVQLVDGSTVQLAEGIEQCRPFTVFGGNGEQVEDATPSDACADVGTFPYTFELVERLAGVLVGSVLNIEQSTDDISTAVQGLSNATSAAPQAINSLARIEQSAETLSTAVTGLADTLSAIEDGKSLIDRTAGSIAGIESALREMATFPFTGPSETDGDGPSGSGSRQSGRSANGWGGRAGVRTTLADLGVTGKLTDEELTRLFPAQAGRGGEVSYQWAGPGVATRTATRTNGARPPGAVQVSGALARFRQKVRVASNEMQEVLATLEPFEGHDVDPDTLATQKQIVLQTMQSILDETERPDGLRQLAVDLHFKSLLHDEIQVTRTTAVNGNIAVLEYLLGVSDNLISDQDVEVYLTEWLRVEDAAKDAEQAWHVYKATRVTDPKYSFGEHLQELRGYFSALSDAVEDAHAMLRTVRFSPELQVAQEYPVEIDGELVEVTIDDLLSMVEDLATNIGPTYITDWKGRGIVTLAARAERLEETTRALRESTDASGKPVSPFSSARVQGAFEHLEQLLGDTAELCDEIANL